MFKIEFIELLILAKHCIPPQTIARISFFKQLSERHYYIMSKEQRKQMFESITNEDWFKYDNKDCKMFADRFNPDNQYLINGKIKCFLHNGNYYSTPLSYVNEEHIKKVVKI
jgi:hypothetical protein